MSSPEDLRALFYHHRLFRMQTETANLNSQNAPGGMSHRWYRLERVARNAATARNTKNILAMSCTAVLTVQWSIIAEYSKEMKKSSSIRFRKQT